MLSGAPFTALPSEAPNSQELADFFWTAAGLFRRHADFGGYKRHFFVLLFYKRLCDIESERQYEATTSLAEAFIREPAHPDPEISHSHMWSNLLRLRGGFGHALSANLQVLGQNNEHLSVLLQCEHLAFWDQELFPDSVLEPVLRHLDQRRLGRCDVDTRTLGAAWELLIGRFADDEDLDQGKRPTPSGVARLLVDLVHPDEGMSIYDPVCGTAGLLLESARYMQRMGKNPSRLSCFGQEKDLGNLALCNLMLCLHQVEPASIRLGDTLRDPQFTDSPDRLSRFDIVIGNPPFSLANWSDEGWGRWEKFGRGTYGCPPRSCGDYAFVLHMLASLSDQGRMAVVLPCGVLYRSGAEARIRERLIREGLLEAVIVLGPKLFLKTNVAVCVLLFKRGRRQEARNRVLIVNGEQEYVRGQPNHLGDEHVQRLVTAVARFRDEMGFCRVVTVDDIQEKGWDLRPGCYMQTMSRDRHGGDGTAFLEAQPTQSGIEPEISPSVGAEDPQIVPADLESIDASIRMKQASLERACRIRARRASEIWTKGLHGESQPHPDLGEIPAHWRLVPLDDLLTTGDGLRNGMSRPLNDPGERAHFLGQNALTQDGEVDLTQARVSTASQGTHSRFVLQNGDVLMKRASGSQCGQAAYVRLLDTISEPFVFASGLVRLRVDPEQIDPLLLVSWLTHPPVYRALQNRALGSLQQYLKQSALRTFPCPQIDAHDHQKIRDELWTCTNLISTLKKQIEDLFEMRRRLCEARA